jgi:hypothetical protein
MIVVGQREYFLSLHEKLCILYHNENQELKIRSLPLLGGLYNGKKECCVGLLSIVNCHV